MESIKRYTNIDLDKTRDFEHFFMTWSLLINNKVIMKGFTKQETES